MQALSFDDLVYLSEEELAQVEAPLTPVWEHPKKSRVQTFDIHPEIPMADRHTFDLASHEVEEVNKKERFHRNYAAITVLKRCQEENRFATPDEQIILSKYVGWGGIPEAYDERAGSWQTEFGMLKSILTPEEYASARESTLTAFYTPPTVINAVYKVMKQLGFREGNILEPSCGIGHFIGMLPEEMKESKIYGVELDTVSAGIAQQLYQKSSIAAQGFEETNLPDSFFATGTPISNSMVELYTIQRYLQYNTLVQNNLQHFDAWASTFGETITAVELTPEGTGYRAKTRFARFYNLPELMAMFKEIADIKTADMLDLPVPKAVFHNISVKPSEIQRDMVAGLAERAERVRNGMVDARVDNMLKITNDGRKLALDQRLINPLLPDFEDSKLNACVDAMFETWERGSEKRLTQLFFCDLSTPKNDGSFNVYDDIRQKLIARGVPADEIKFIHEADTEAKKLELFKKVRRGDVRILMGSTQKMGAGTNVQNKLAASSDLDCPWRPSDLEQRLGRSIRQGNENAEVHIYRFVTEETFDPEPIPLGEYRGFTMELYFEAREYKVRLKGELGYPVTLGTDTFGNITRLDNTLEGLPKRLEMNEMELDNLKKQFETAKVDVERPFPQEEELKAKTDRLNELNALLNVDKRENEIVGGEPDEGEEPPEKKPRDLER